MPGPQAFEFASRCVILTAVLWLCSRPVLSFKVRFPLQSLGVGVAMFLLWIGPDALIPGYRQHWLFSSWLTEASKSLDPSSQTDAVALVFRILRAVILVPIIEELFWRAWALRWIVRTDFQTLPMGSYNQTSFWIVALLFAAEHGPYWEVGLICGVVYNWWMGRTRSLGDLIFTHAVTNGCLCAYVLIAKKWEYWVS